MKKQRGAIAIEFAALFVVFFAIVYAVIAYSIPLLLILTFKQVSSDAGRAAIKVDQALPDTEYTQVVSDEVTRVIQASWLPSDWFTGNCPAPKESSHQWIPLPPSAGAVSYGFLAKDSLDAASNNYRYILQVCLQRKYGTTGSANEKAIIPTLNIMGIQIPKLPEKGGEVVIRNQTTVRL
jgi:hypothetical protein